MVGATGFELWKPNLLLTVANDKATWRQLMSQSTMLPQTQPSDCEATADLFGITLHLQGRRFYIPYDQVKAAIKALSECQWIEAEPLPVVNPAIKKVNDDFMADPVGRSIQGWSGE